MLFDFKTEKPVMMWMKNTYLPLDMIFIAKSGRVSGIAENTEPMSEKIIPSGAPAYSVLGGKCRDGGQKSTSKSAIRSATRCSVNKGF